MRQTTIEPIRLSSGTSLVIVPDPNAPATVVAVSVRISGVELRRQPGVVTLLARMLGMDSQGRTPELLQRDVDAFGALGTGYDGNQLSAWSVSPPTEEGLIKSTQTLLMNSLAQPRFTDESLEQARTDQLRSVALFEEELVPKLLLALRTRALGTELSVQGDEASLRHASVADVRGVYTRFCTPERTSIAVIGKFEPDVARRWVEISLSVGDWNRRAVGMKEKLPVTEAIPAGLRDQVLRGTPPGVAALGVAYLFPGMSNPESRADWAALLVLDAVLGLGKACRLFRLRDTESVGYEVRSQLLPGRDSTLWMAYVLGNQDPGVMKAALLNVLNGTTRKPIADAELLRAKNLLLAQHTQQRQLVLNRARALAWAESSGLGAAFELELTRRIEAVKRTDVERVAKQLFSGNPALVRTR